MKLTAAPSLADTQCAPQVVWLPAGVSPVPTSSPTSVDTTSAPFVTVAPTPPPALGIQTAGSGFLSGVTPGSAGAAVLGSSVPGSAGAALGAASATSAQFVYDAPTLPPALGIQAAGSDVLSSVTPGSAGPAVLGEVPGSAGAALGAASRDPGGSAGLDTLGQPTGSPVPAGLGSASSAAPVGLSSNSGGAAGFYQASGSLAPAVPGHAPTTPPAPVGLSSSGGTSPVTPSPVSVARGSPAGL